MTNTGVTDIRGTEDQVTSWLASAVWAVVLRAASRSACVAVRLFQFLQWGFVQQMGMFPLAATLSPARRILTPIIGAASASFTARKSAAELHFED